jgi:hypothetical protein
MTGPDLPRRVDLDAEPKKGWAGAFEERVLPPG